MRDKFLSGETADPDARSGGLAQVDGFSGGAKSHGFVVLAFFDAEFCAGTQMQAVKEFQKLAVFFVDADDFRGIFRAQFREQHDALFAKLRDSATNRNAMGATASVTEAFQKKGLDFGRDGMLEAFGFVVSFGPREADNVGEEHLGELMAKSHTLGELAALAGEVDAAGTIDANEVVAREAFERSGDSGRCDGELFRETRTDGGLPFFEHFPNCFQIIFARYAGLLPLHTSLCLLRICADGWRAIR